MQPFYDRRRIFASALEVVSKLVYTVPFIRKIFFKLTKFKYVGDVSGNEINIVVDSNKKTMFKKLKIKYTCDDTSYPYISVYYDYIVDSEGRPVPKNIVEFNNDISNGIYFNSKKYTFTDKTELWDSTKDYYYGNTVYYSGTNYVCVKPYSHGGRPDIIHFEWKQAIFPYFEFDEIVGDETNFVAYSYYKNRIANYSELVDSNYKLSKKVNIEFKNVTSLDGYTDPPYMCNSETYNEQTGYSGIAILTCPDGYVYENPVYYSPFYGYTNIKSIKFSSDVQFVNTERTFYGLFRYFSEQSSKSIGLDRDLEISGVTVHGLDKCESITVDSDSLYFFDSYDMLFEKPGINYGYKNFIGKKLVYALPKYRKYIIDNLFSNKYDNKLFFMTIIGNSAFAYSNLGVIDKLMIPPNVRSISYCAFAGCDIKSLYLNSSFNYYNFCEVTLDITEYCQEYTEIFHTSTGDEYAYKLGGILENFTQLNGTYLTGGTRLYFVNNSGDVVSMYYGESWFYRDSSVIHPSTQFNLRPHIGEDFGALVIGYSGTNLFRYYYNLRVSEIIPNGYKVYFSFHYLGNTDTEGNYGINDYAFIGCPIEKIVSDSNSNMQWGNVNDVRWLVKDTLQTLYIGSDEDNASYKLNYKSVQSHGYENCVNLSYVNMNRRVSSVGEYAFANCVSLYYIDFNDELSLENREFDFHIYPYAFYNCKIMRTLDRSDKRIFQLPSRYGYRETGGILNTYYCVDLLANSFVSCGTFDIFSTGVGYLNLPYYAEGYVKKFNHTYIKELHINATYGLYFNCEDDNFKTLEVVKVNYLENSNCLVIRPYDLRVYNNIHSSPTEEEEFGYIDTELIQHGDFLKGFYNLKELYFYGNLGEIKEWTFYACPIKKIVIDVDVSELVIGNYSMNYDEYYSNDETVYPSLTDNIIEDFYLYNEINMPMKVHHRINGSTTYYTRREIGSVVYYDEFTGSNFRRGTPYYINISFGVYRLSISNSNGMNIYTYNSVLDEYTLYTRDTYPRPSSGTSVPYYWVDAYDYPFLKGRKINNLYIKNGLKNILYLKEIATNINYINEQHYPDNPHY